MSEKTITLDNLSKFKDTFEEKFVSYEENDDVDAKDIIGSEIDDTKSSKTTTYSSEMIDSKIKAIYDYIKTMER